MRRVSIPSNDSLRATEFELGALNAGVSMPRPVTALEPLFGWVADIPGFGQFQLREWMPARVLADTDDCAKWLGARVGHAAPHSTAQGG